MDPTPAAADELDAVVQLIASEQSRPERNIAYLGTEARGIRAELDALEPAWTETARIVRADDATIFGAAVIEWDASAGRSWVQGPWVAGDDDAWTLHAPSLLDAALTQLPANVHRMELSGEVANTRLAALAAQRGWRPSGVHHTLIADDATIARWAPATARDHELRVADDRDLDDIAVLHDAEFPATHTPAARLIAEQTTIVAVGADGTVAGYAAGQVHPDGEGYVDYVAVNRAARGLGIGRALVVDLARRLIGRSPTHQVALVVDDDRAPRAGVVRVARLRDRNVIRRVSKLSDHLRRARTLAGMAHVERRRTLPHMSHWGAFSVTVDGDSIVAVDGHPDDPAPSPLLANFVDGIRNEARVTRPAVRRGWLERGPGPDATRGADAFVEVDWPEALDLVARELQRVRTEHGNEAIYGGSYGWASAGRFHHAQSQLHRFLNTIGGYTASWHSYSLGASEVILPHVVGGADEVLRRATTWKTILENTELVVAFGGMNVKNAWVSPGGVTRHTLAPSLEAAGKGGLAFELFSPLRSDLDSGVDATWHPIIPGTDTAVMLALAFVIVSEGRHDTEFLARHTVGADRLIAYVLGEADGQPKSPEWAESISGLPAQSLYALARRMAERRTMVTVSWALQRTRHGEQPVWMGIALAALLGQLGLPGGGFGHGYGSMADVGLPRVPYPLPVFAQGRNPVTTFIPVAQISTLLENPGGTLDYNGLSLPLPDIRLVYWAGGNPFHHHQDLNRLRRALGRPDTIVVHEPFWTATARHADIVLPTTTTLERDDLGAGRNDGYVIAMPRAMTPYGEARDDYEAFSELAKRLDAYDEFTEGRTARDWVEHIYEKFRTRVAERDVEVPSFDDFWETGEARLPIGSDDHTLFDRFRADPDGRKLATPSGRIELFSETIAGYGYDDCLGHPAWLEPEEWLGGERAARFPLHLIANQPSSRLHGQLDAGAHSRASKVAGREPIRIHPDDAAARGIADGDVVRVYNDRGACLAGAIVTDAVRPQVVNLSTGAWYDPLDPTQPDSLCVHGNPNVLTADRGSSRLAQGSTGQHVLVEIERFEGDAPRRRAGRAHGAAA